MDLNQIKPLAQEYGQLTDRHWGRGLPLDKHPDHVELEAKRKKLNDQLRTMVGEYLSEKGNDPTAVQELKATLTEAGTLGNAWWPIDTIEAMLQGSAKRSTED